MDFLIEAMIFAGSALMVYNIVRCYRFIKRMRTMTVLGRVQLILPVPFILLVLFLIGYLTVGIFGSPDMVIAGILFGGSVFVFIVFTVMYKIIDKLQESNARSDALYADIRENLQELAQDYLSVFRVNLTRDIIEARSGVGLFETDADVGRYTDLMAQRSAHLIGGVQNVGERGLFTREGLLEAYDEGRFAVEERLLIRFAPQRAGFVKLEAKLAQKPDTDEIIAFITERSCDDEMVNEALLGKALIEEFDMITALFEGRYRVVIGEAGQHRRGSIFPKAKEGSYDCYLDEQVAPVISSANGDRDKLIEALRLFSVEKELNHSDSYEVNISVLVDGDVYYKRFVFYVVDTTAHFYVLLKSDTTEARKEEIARSERLQAALEEAERASKSKTTFLSNMSHDIRTPMNAIVGYTEIAKKSESIDEAREYLEKIDASNKHMLALINDVLEMSRIESGKMELTYESADLCKLLDDVKGVFEVQMREKGIAFEVDHSGVTDAKVLCDKTRLNRVLLNLVSNAYKFTQEGGSVSVRLEQLGVADGRASYELRVKDTGMGMSPEFAKRVFDAFERERNTTVSGIQGTGLGMAITKSIVDQMGGTIEVHTQEGLGTEFVIDVAYEIDESSASLAAEPADTGLDVVDFEGMRVLLVEDNEINREIASMVLDDVGFIVEEAFDGKQALDRLVEAGPRYFDIVITDIQMPVMNGYEEARAIRALDDPELSSIPIIAMSANAFQEDKQASKDAGMDDHIAKPVDVGVLLDTLSRVLARANG